MNPSFCGTHDYDLELDPPLVVAAVVIGFILLKRLGQVPAEVARGYLKHGALVIDVRSAGEFNSGHLPVA